MRSPCRRPFFVRLTGSATTGAPLHVECGYLPASSRSTRLASRSWFSSPGRERRSSEPSGEGGPADHPTGRSIGERRGYARARRRYRARTAKPPMPVPNSSRLIGSGTADGTDDTISKWSVTAVTGAGNRLWNAPGSPPAYTWLLCTKTVVGGLLPSVLIHMGVRVPVTPVMTMFQTAVSACLSRPVDVEKKLGTLCGVAPGMCRD